MPVVVQDIPAVLQEIVKGILRSDHPGPHGQACLGTRGHLGVAARSGTTRAPMPLRGLLSQESRVWAAQLPRELDFHLCLSTENQLMLLPGLSDGKFHQFMV